MLAKRLLPVSFSFGVWLVCALRKEKGEKKGRRGSSPFSTPVVQSNFALLHGKKRKERGKKKRERGKRRKGSPYQVRRVIKKKKGGGGRGKRKGYRSNPSTDNIESALVVFGRIPI